LIDRCGLPHVPRDSLRGYAGDRLGCAVRLVARHAAWSAGRPWALRRRVADVAVGFGASFAACAGRTEFFCRTPPFWSRVVAFGCGCLRAIATTSDDVGVSRRLRRRGGWNPPYQKVRSADPTDAPVYTAGAGSILMGSFASLEEESRRARVGCERLVEIGDVWRRICGRRLRCARRGARPNAEEGGHYTLRLREQHE
jgi:hypothetical protein